MNFQRNLTLQRNKYKTLSEEQLLTSLEKKAFYDL